MSPRVTALRLGRLGDLVMTLPALGALEAVCALRLVSDEPYVAWLRSELPRTEVLTPDEAGPDPDCALVLDLHGAPRARRVRRRIRGGARVVSVDKQTVGRHALLRGPTVRGALGSSLRALGVRAPARSWPRRHLLAAQEAARILGLAPLDAETEPRSSLPRRPERGRLVICPATSRPGKSWPAERWGELTRRWLARGGEVVALVAPGEEAAAEPAVRAGARAPSAPTVLSLRDRLAEADAVVAGDTGPLHLAGALGVPVVGVFGPTPRAAGFWVWERGVPLEPEVSCAPCSLHGPSRCPRGHGSCLGERSVGSVLDALRALRVEVREAS